MNLSVDDRIALDLGRRAITAHALTARTEGMTDELIAAYEAIDKLVKDMAPEAVQPFVDGLPGYSAWVADRARREVV
jgi:hypothetical protein